MQEPELIKLYSLEEFCLEFLTKEQIISLGKVISKEHTWGDSGLTAITGHELVDNLTECSIVIPSWLGDHLGELFELDGTSFLWEEGRSILLWVPEKESE